MRHGLYLYPGLVAVGVVLSVSRPVRSSTPSPKPAPPAPTAANAAEGVAFFETRIRPVLAEKCYACHSEKKAFGGLRLDAAAALRKGGDSGPLWVAGKKESRLLKALHHDGLKMPPAEKLPAAVLADFEKWVSLGAPLPSGAAEQVVGIDMAAGRKHWAFQPVRELAQPKLAQPGWVRKKLDAFVLQKLESRALRPSPRADRRTLIRRVSFDLTGLPPTAEEAEAFVRDPAPDAYAKLVDRLLASPQYGERWARHWLDVARYAEDNPTSEATNPPPAYPWRYRDWVVKALNEDLPYGEFLRRQLAADLISDLPPTELAATGFLGLSPVYHKEPMLARDVIETIAADEWDERLDTVTRGFLGLTVACARCHDHKFDPITAQDYYALAGVMASTQLVEWPLVRMPADQAEKLAQVEREIRSLERDLRRQRRDLSRATPDTEDHRKAEAAVKETEGKIAKAKEKAPNYGAPIGTVVRDAGLWVDGSNPSRTRMDYRPGTPRDLPVFIRGSVSRTGEIVPRRFLEVLSPGKPAAFQKGSGRLELADAMLNEGAALTARVMVNRVWGWHFGQPLVDTPSNFGKLGSKPSHPELLDDLSARFIKNGWSLKWLHREIVLSATYQQASNPALRTATVRVKQPAGAKPNPQSQIRNPKSPNPQSVDPENRLLWRMNPRRLEVEAWRDAILQIAGALDLAAGGPSGDLEDLENRRRTLYGRISRQRPADILRLFDFPDANRHGEIRLATTTPVQQLYFLNSPFVQQHAARITVKERGEGITPEQRVAALFRRILHRAPSAAEVERALKLVQDPSGEDWGILAQALLSSNEFLFVD